MQLADEASREMTTDQVRKKTLARAIREKSAKSQVFKKCNIWTLLTATEKIVHENMKNKHLDSYH